MIYRIVTYELIISVSDYFNLLWSSLIKFEQVLVDFFFQIFVAFSEKLNFTWYVPKYAPSENKPPLKHGAVHKLCRLIKGGEGNTID